MTAIESLPTPARRHRWNEKFTIPIGRSGCEESHRICAVCSLIRITVHPPHGAPYRLWQYDDGERADGLTPMCAGEGGA